MISSLINFDLLHHIKPINMEVNHFQVQFHKANLICALTDHIGGLDKNDPKILKLTQHSMIRVIYTL